MTNEEVLEKMLQDMKMRNFSHYTYEFYIGKTKEMMRYFNKPIEEVTIKEYREYLYKHLLQERKLCEHTVNHYNSVIRFMLEVTLDRLINKKQIPMRKKVYKVLTQEELSTFFSLCDNYKFKTIFMLVYGSGLRIGEVVNLHKSDIDSKAMRIFVREGKGNKERYTILPKVSLKMLRKYWKDYRPKVKTDKIFFIDKLGDSKDLNKVEAELDNLKITEEEINYIASYINKIIGKEYGKETSNQMIELLKKRLSKEEGKDMLLENFVKTCFEEGEKSGRKKGETIGETRGIARGISQVAINMLKEKCDKKIIKKCTGLSEAKLKELEKTLQSA